MFATSERVSPCRARCSPRSVGRLTTSCSPSRATSMSLWMRSDSSPLGPFTRTDPGSIATVTPAGTAIGCLPILDIARSAPSPDLGEDLAADARRARVVAGHHAMRGGHDRRAHAPEHLRDVLGIDVCAPSRTRNATQPRDGRTSVLGVLQPNLDQLPDALTGCGKDRPRLYVPLLGQYPRQLALHFGRGNLDRLVRGVDRVAHAREEISDRIGHRHGEDTLRDLPRERASVVDMSGWSIGGRGAASTK